jgi:hypothetical protein
VAPAAAAGSRAPGPDSGAGGTARPVAGTAASTLQEQDKTPGQIRNEHSKF